ncbi:MAG: HTH-type transcriptional regulator GntR [Paracidovorax wautersii]|uniref:HTH-type transcriptional regulator GntR n=1 Tax=Paracidovorax wautersii TaxID=1177982 RepID=A0A7V8JPY9_9BURK|nr:MAG: HTH-type transcriptional regulator GntR [Paracidovorax wautersii]
MFCNNDLLAAGVLFECRERGLKVPRQMAVMGLGDMPIAAAASPRLTTIRVHRRRMGEIAARLLMERLDGKQAGPITIDIGFEVVRRSSA